MNNEVAKSTVSGTIKTNLSKFHKKFILFICFFECQAPMFKIYQNTFGDSCSEMSSKLNEFVIAVDERDGDMYGYGQYVAY